LRKIINISYFRSTISSSKSNILFIGLLFSYILFYPPFRSSDTPALIPFRLTIETLVLIYLLIKTQLVSPGRIQVNLLLAILLILLFGMFGPEHIRNVFSLLNKFLFFFLLLKVLQNDYKLLYLIRKVWILFWQVICYSSIIAIFTYTTGLLPFYEHNYFDAYTYYHFPLLGSISYRGSFPRYVGYMYEHGFLAFYFSINYLLSNLIYDKKPGYNWFKSINLIGGLLTLSFSFYLFYLFYLFQVFLNKIKLRWAFLFFLPIIINYAIYFFNNPEALIGTSLIDRVWRVEGAINILSKMNLLEIIFGMGTFESRIALGGGLGVGVFSMFLGRGILLSIFYLFLMIKYTKHNIPFCIFILYYSLIFGEIFFYPITLLIVTVGYCLYNKYDFYNHISTGFSTIK